MTWPTEDGGGGRSAARAVRGVRGAHRRRRADRRRCGSPTARWARRCCSSARDEQRRRWLPGHPRRRVDVVHRHERARRRLRRGRRCAPGPMRDGDELGRQRPEGVDVRRRARRLDATSSPAPTPTPRRTPGLSEFVVDMRSPGIEVTPIVDMTGNRHFCEVHLDDVRVPADNLVGELNGSFRQVMRQMEHERGGIDRLVSNRRAVRRRARAGGRHVDDPLVRQEIAAHRDRLPDRSAARAARGAAAGARAGSRPPPRRSAPSSSSGSPTSAPASPAPAPCCWTRRRPRRRAREHLLRARLHDHGRHHADPAQHPRRTGARPPPVAPTGVTTGPPSGARCPGRELLMSGPWS